MTGAPFKLQGGDPAQQKIVADAVAACDFPWDLMSPGMQAKGWQSIPVEFADLTRQAAVDGVHVFAPNRRGTLGLYWYKGLIQVERSLVGSDPRMASQVILAEGAHAVDDTYMTEAMHRALVRLWHPGGVDDGHGWFDQGSYAEWEGEAWMGLFLQTYAPTLYGSRLFGQFAHQTKDVAGARQIVTPNALTPTPGPVDDACLALRDALDGWAHARHSGANRRAAQAFLVWEKAKGL